MKTSGVYIVRNIVTNQVYIGSSVNMHHRFCQHKSALGKNKHDNKLLQESYNEHGEKAFEYKVLKEVAITCKQDLYIIENEYLNEYKEMLFNICPRAESSQNAKWKLNDKAKQAIALATKRRWEDPEYKKRMIESKKNKNFKHSEESIKKMSENKKGKPYVMTEARRDAIDKRKGVPLSAEHKEKIGAASSKQWEDLEYRERILKNLNPYANKGKSHSAEIKEKRKQASLDMGRDDKGKFITLNKEGDNNG